MGGSFPTLLFGPEKQPNPRVFSLPVRQISEVNNSYAVEAQ